MFNSYYEAEEAEVREEEDFENTEANARIASAYIGAALNAGQMANQFAFLDEDR